MNLNKFPRLQMKTYMYIYICKKCAYISIHLLFFFFRVSGLGYSQSSAASQRATVPGALEEVDRIPFKGRCRGSCRGVTGVVYGCYGDYVRIMVEGSRFKDLVVA